MRTRCPACSTVFRVTSEQLRLRAGKVRCGSCQTVFNAFDELVSEANEPLLETPVVDEMVHRDEVVAAECEQTAEAQECGTPEAEPAIEPETDLAVQPDIEANLGPDLEEETAFADASGAMPADDEDESARQAVLNETQDSFAEPSDDEPVVEIEPVAEAALELAAEEPGPVAEEPELVQEPLAEPLVESPEESTEAARQAGLVAARELTEPAGSFNRWSAGTLASDGLGGFEAESNQRAVWPFVLVAIVLCIGLLGQMLFYFRTDVVLRFPGMAGLYELTGVDIPLPRNAALVSIETSDLQSDNARGLFVLQATLKNRASYGQAWPALELSLTDTSDAVVSRRVIFAADYLPPGTTSETFPANGEMPVKLWIEAKESGASGYRLYIFYP